MASSCFPQGGSISRGSEKLLNPCLRVVIQSSVKTFPQNLIVFTTLSQRPF